MALVIVQLSGTYTDETGAACTGEVVVTPTDWTSSGHQRHPPIPVTMRLAAGVFTLPVLAPATAGDPACRYHLEERIEITGGVLRNEYTVTMPRATAGDLYDLGDLTEGLTWTAPSTPGTGTAALTDTF
jgi:hypothetical protein